ncbi:MAG TPA: ATP-binding cassette domain-containing protein [Sphingomicrobium sp.]|jgi:ABC-type multidrug transport system fused ATPase/permease subunit
MSKAFDSRLKVAQESFGGIRDIIIDGTAELHARAFESIDKELTAARADTGFIAAAPRYVIETVGIVIIAIAAAWYAGRTGGVAAALPVLGAMAFGAQRLLPVVQQVYHGWSTASGYLSVLAQATDLLRLKVDPNGPKNSEPLPLRRCISIEDLTFTYKGRADPALEAVTFEIPAGSAVALVGETGSGKSTLADLLMGLLEPGSGRITIDGVPLIGETRVRWQRSIAHVPQTIFLADSSIARNIALALGDDALDMDRVIEAARQAQLHAFVESLPDGFDTLIGERGVRLSGGQRQRLGLAGAIYKQAPVLVLDEATSALDEATEAR